MSVYAVFQERVENPELFRQYLEKAVPTVPQYGGTIVAFDENAEVVEGTTDYPQTVLLQFPSRDDFHAWYQSPEYQAVVNMRLEAAPSVCVVAKAFTPPT